TRFSRDWSSDVCSSDLATRLDEARRRLLDVREAREQPGRDEKILVSWNALAIRGLAIASRQLERDDWQQAAEAALQFIRDHQWRSEERRVGKERSSWGR